MSSIGPFLAAAAALGAVALAWSLGWSAAGEAEREAEAARAALEQAVERERDVQAEAERLRAAAEAAGSELAELQQSLAALRLDLARERDRRIERERGFLEYGRLLAGLNLGRPGAGPALDALLREHLGLPPAEPAAPAEPDPEAVAEEERQLALRAHSDSMARTFNALLRTQGVVGLELMEAGLEHEGGLGPVVFRLLDGDGRLAGHLAAARLRLEGSKNGRSLTLVLSEGHEAGGGERVPFADGVRRLVLRPVDLWRFAEEFPGLFDAELLAEPVDDGRWPLGLVRLRLNELLAADAARGYHRLAWLGGVVGDEWRDVALEVRDGRGKVERILIADRMRLFLEESSSPAAASPFATAVLELRDGVSERGGLRAPFLDGRLRVVLPRVDAQRWRAAGLPGLMPSPAEANGDEAQPSGAARALPAAAGALPAQADAGS